MMIVDACVRYFHASRIKWIFSRVEKCRLPCRLWLLLIYFCVCNVPKIETIIFGRNNFFSSLFSVSIQFLVFYLFCFFVFMLVRRYKLNDPHEKNSYFLLLSLPFKWFIFTLTFVRLSIWFGFSVRPTACVLNAPFEIFVFTIFSFLNVDYNFIALPQSKYLFVLHLTSDISRESFFSTTCPLATHQFQQIIILFTSTGLNFDCNFFEILFLCFRFRISQTCAGETHRNDGRGCFRVWEISELNTKKIIFSWNIKNVQTMNAGLRAIKRSASRTTEARRKRHFMQCHSIIKCVRTHANISNRSVRSRWMI